MKRLIDVVSYMKSLIKIRNPDYYQFPFHTLRHLSPHLVFFTHVLDIIVSTGLIQISQFGIGC